MYLRYNVNMSALNQIKFEIAAKIVNLSLKSP